MEPCQLLVSILSKIQMLKPLMNQPADDFEMELARATPEEKQECLERV